MFIDLQIRLHINGDLDHVQRRLNDAAVELALLGEVDIARQMCEALPAAVMSGDLQ